jgi:hypothetical protein
MMATLVGFIFWFFRRRSNPSTDTLPSDRLSRVSDTVASETCAPSNDSGGPSPTFEVNPKPMEGVTGAAGGVTIYSGSKIGMAVENVEQHEIAQPPELQRKIQPPEEGESESGREPETPEQQSLLRIRQATPAPVDLDPSTTDQKSEEPQLPIKSPDMEGVENEQAKDDETHSLTEARHVPILSPTGTIPIEHQKAAGNGSAGNEDEPSPKQEATSKVEVAPASVQHATHEKIEVGTEQAPLSQDKEQSPTEDDEQSPPQPYRPPSQRPPRRSTKRKEDRVSETGAASEVLLGIHVRLTLDRFAFCEVGFLPERSSQLDDEVTVKFAGAPVLLMAQEDWYQDLQFEKSGDRLRLGLELKGRLADNRDVRWLLTGRPLYVLASHQRASGFVSTNRLVLGRSHIVLCAIELRQQVEAILGEAGCQGYSVIDESHGLPLDWIALRGVLPTKAIPLELGSDPFYAVKPAPDIEIQLDGGVCLRNSVWLAGYPPRIKLLGQSNGAVKVLIDGKEAQDTPEGFLIADGYDQPGQQHSIYCEGSSCSCSYSIEEPPDSWQEWRAYQFGQADICGPLVRPVAEAANKRTLSVPMSNPLLLGAEPGQIFQCSTRSVAHWKGFVPFDVVWALPAYPLACDKRTARILQFAQTPVSAGKSHTKAVLDWCKAILDASRKGMRVDSDSAEATARWAEYKKAARKMWRAAR